jgi:hypothetical protein
MRKKLQATQNFCTEYTTIPVLPIVTPVRGSELQLRHYVLGYHWALAPEVSGFSLPL